MNHNPQVFMNGQGVTCQALTKNLKRGKRGQRQDPRTKAAVERIHSNLPRYHHRMTKKKIPFKFH
jgi:hypothetical protein